MTPSKTCRHEGVHQGEAVSGIAWTVEDHLRGKPASVVDLYRRFFQIVQRCGPVELSVARTAITFKGSRRGFAGAKPTNRSLDGYLDLQARLSDPRIRRVDPYTKRLFVHHFRITSSDELDAEFASWVREAYQVGQGAHLQRWCDVFDGRPDE